MIRDLLIESFREGEYLICFFAWLASLGLCFLLFAGAHSLFKEIEWMNCEKFTWEATLVSGNFQPSTVKTNTVPIVSSNGNLSFGVLTTGESEKYITVWDCGKYGRIVCEDEKVFRFAKPRSMLVVKQLDDELRIVDIFK